MPLCTNESTLLEVATAARRFIEPIWLEWHRAWGGDLPAIASQWTCGRSSLFLARVLIAQGLDAHWASGAPRSAPSGPDIGPYGFFCGERWQSHAWVECGDYIVDITADQFGAPPVLVVDSTDTRYNKGDRDTALPEFVLARQRAVDAIWPRWQSMGSPAPEGSPTQTP